MHHHLKSIILIVVLVVAAGLVGLIVSGNDITGAVVGNTIACYDHSDCNDKIQATEDVCKNPGTINSLCVSKRIEN